MARTKQRAKKGLPQRPKKQEPVVPSFPVALTVKAYKKNLFFSADQVLILKSLTIRQQRNFFKTMKYLGSRKKQHQAISAALTAAAGSNPLPQEPHPVDAKSLLAPFVPSFPVAQVFKVRKGNLYLSADHASAFDKLSREQRKIFFRAIHDSIRSDILWSTRDQDQAISTALDEAISSEAPSVTLAEAYMIS